MSLHFKSRRSACHIAFLIAFLTGLPIFAQTDITVTTTIKPPYSPYLSDYVGFDNKLVITLINTKPQNFNVRLVGSIKGNNGVTITIPDNFIPNNPIALAPNQTKMLFGAQLKDYLNADNLQFSGITKSEVVQGNGLPEGSYQFCIQAKAYNSNQALSLPAPAGCAVFNITHYEPPMLLQPVCNGEVNGAQPQNVVFSWTIPAGAPPNKMEYVLKIVEMAPQNINPNQAMLAATDPPFFEKTVNVPSYLYGPSDPKLEEGKKYAVRVTAKNVGLSKELNFKNNGHSVVCAFTFGQQIAQNDPQNNNQDQNDQNENDENNNNNQDLNDIEENYANPCDILNCAPQPLPTGPPANKTYQVGDEIQIGYFIMKLTSLSSAQAGNLSGEGEIDAPLFNVKLKATFQGLKVNQADKVYQGEAIGAYDPGSTVDNALKNFSNNLDNIAAQKVKTVSDFVKSKQKYVENFVNVESTGLPFAWSKLVSSKLQLVNIVALKFEPDGARFNAFFNMTIPEANNKVLAFGQKNICFHPTGLSIDGLQKLTMLGNDYTFPWGQNIDLTIKAVGGQNGGTYVKWDCEGYKEMQIDGEFKFKNSMLTKTEGNGPVTAAFTFNAGRWGDMLGLVDMDDFEVKGLEGLKFAFDDVILDFSDKRNPQNMVFPANYAGGQGNDWRGFYFKKIDVTLPKYLKNNGQNVTVTLKDALINKLGFTGKVKVQPVVQLDNGNLGGWAFSIDLLEIALLNNSLTTGEFAGKLKIPVAKTGLGYECLLSNTQQGLKTMFAIETLDDLSVDMWAANLQLNNGSSLSVESIQNDVTVQAKLSGKLTITKSFPDMKNVSVKIPDVVFQDFTIKNKKPYVSFALFAFASPSKSFAGFPINIDAEKGDGIKIKTDNPADVSKIGIQLGFHIGLDGNDESAIAGGTAFTVWAKRSTDNKGRQKWEFDKTELNKIEIDVQVANVEMYGSIELFKNDPTYGQGFRGRIEAVFRPAIELYATVQFGSKPKENNPNQKFRYWYVDAMVKIPTGLPIYPTFGFYGFGGGAWYHMKKPDVLPAAADLEGSNNLNDPDFDIDAAGAGASGIEFIPDESVDFGLRATIVMGLYPPPSDEVFNGDIWLEAQFVNGGLDYIGFGGNGYFVTSPEDRSSSILTATADFKFYANPPKFHGELTVTFELGSEDKPIVKGTGTAVIHFEKMPNNGTKWYVSVGQPNDRILLTVFNKLEIGSYFMVGSHIPGPPPLPAKFAAASELDEFPLTRGPQAASGTGFAFGQHFKFDSGDLRFLIFYARIAIEMGYDVTIRKLMQSCPQAKDGGLMGFRGWYAEGQVYAGLDAEVGIDIDVWFFKTKFSIFSAYIYGSLQAGLPNPTWVKGNISGGYDLFNGQITGSFTFNVEAGKYCDPNGSDDPFKGIEVIADIKPPTGKKNVDVFTYPEVAFNFPMGSTVDLLEIKKDGLFKKKNVIHKFRFKIKDYTIHRKEKGEYTELVEGGWIFAEQKKAAVYNNDIMFVPKSWHKLQIRIYGEKQQMVDDKANGVWKVVKKKNSNVTHYEIGKSFFKTSSGPKKFDNSFKRYTYPYNKQRYFYPQQSKNGVFAFTKNPYTIFEAKPKNNKYKYVYKVKFNEVYAGSTTVHESTMKHEKVDGIWMVRYNIPPSLKTNTIYQLQFVMRLVKKPVDKMGPGNNAPKSTLTTTTKTTKLQQNVDTTNLMHKKKTRINQSIIADNEHLLYQYFFKTSKFETFKKKYEDYAKSSPGGNLYGHKAGTQNRRIDVKLKGTEAFDYYDLNPISYTTYEKKYMNPPVMVEAWIMESWYDNSPFWSLVHGHHRFYVEFFAPRGINPMTVGTAGDFTNTPRKYPNKTAYTPGSRTTRETTPQKDLLPVNAVDLEYTGNGQHNKLTSNEINKAFFKKPPGNNKPNSFPLLKATFKAKPKGKSPGLNFKITPKNPNAKGIKLYAIKKPKPNGGGGGQGMAGNMNTQFQNEIHDILTIRYDVVRVMREDQLIVSKAVDKTWGGDAQANGMRDSYLEKVAYDGLKPMKDTGYPVKIKGYALPPGVKSKQSPMNDDWYIKLKTF